MMYNIISTTILITIITVLHQSICTIDYIEMMTYCYVESGFIMSPPASLCVYVEARFSSPRARI